MTNRQQIARYLEQEREVLIPGLAAAIDTTSQDGLTVLVKDWLENLIALLRDKPCPLADWAAQFTDYIRTRETPVGEAFANIERLRKALVACCQGKITRVSDSDLLAAFSDATALFSQAVFAQFAEPLSRQPAVRRRPHQDGLKTETAPPAVINTGETGASDSGLRYIQEYLLPLVPFAAQLLDGTGNIIYSSKEITDLPVNGYEGQEPLCCFLYHQRHGEQSECPCKGVFKTAQFYLGEIQYDSRMEMKWFRLLIAPVPDDNGRIACVLSCVYDMTRRKQIQKQLESEIIEQQRSSLVAQISVTVAHQLRNPLSVVLGFAEMMAKGLAPEQYAEAVSRILRNSIRCKDIVESLLDFGKGMPLERRVVDFEVLIRESVLSLLPPDQNRLVTWNFSGKPMLIECVPEQMTQVVLSMLQNAFHAAQSKIVCTLDNKGDLIRLRVVDDGPGIPPDLRERIFEPFYTTRRSEGATGLGLSLARAAVADYGGSLTVCAPMPGEPRGACLVLQLPVLNQSGTAPETANAPGNAIQVRRVLIVDDESDMQDLLRTSLYLHGFLADTVGTGMEALEKLKQNDYGAVVLDYKIEGVLSCSQLYAEITDQYAHLIPHIMFLTGDMLNYQARVFIKETGRPFLEKPFRIKDFLAKLNRLLG